MKAFFKKHKFTISTLIVLWPLLLVKAWAHHIEVSNVKIRALPPGVPNTAAYMKIVNNGASNISLDSVTADISDRIELHEHQHVDGLMKMRQVEKIQIAAGDSAALQPGGYHVMLFGLKKAVKPGNKVKLTLHFSDGSNFTVKATAVKPGQSQHHH